MNVGNKIRTIRKSKNLSITEVESRAGISEGNLSRIETGKQWPREDTLAAIAAALECRIADFFTITDAHAAQPIPLITYSQTEAAGEAGEMFALHQTIDEYAASHAVRWIPADAAIPGKAFALEIGDHSMLPEFQKNDVVIIDPDMPPQPGDFVLARAGQETLFRKYRPRGTRSTGDMVFHLIPLNEDYPAFRSDITTITLIGTMLEHRRYRKN
ncbi:MAG: LexA family transcriptional regulator [Oxalobacter formigenes]|nr:LexA family transcriptional regulator [Oxalobacter formigenes]